MSRLRTFLEVRTGKQTMKHKPYRRNDGFWSCGVCKWKFATRPSKDNCPGVLRIERANDEYKTEKQWRKRGFEVIPDEHGLAPKPDAVSIVHSTDWHGYYHRDHVRLLPKSQADVGWDGTAHYMEQFDNEE